MSDGPGNYDELENCINTLRNYREARGHALKTLRWDMVAIGFEAIREELLFFKGQLEDRLPENPGWIPVTDDTPESDLPPAHQEVLLRVDMGGLGIVHVVGLRGHIRGDVCIWRQTTTEKSFMGTFMGKIQGEITHWHRLPITLPD